MCMEYARKPLSEIVIERMRAWKKQNFREGVKIRKLISSFFSRVKSIFKIKIQVGFHHAQPNDVHDIVSSSELVI